MRRYRIRLTHEAAGLLGMHDSDAALVVRHLRNATWEVDETLLDELIIDATKMGLGQAQRHMESMRRNGVLE